VLKWGGSLGLHTWSLLSVFLEADHDFLLPAHIEHLSEILPFLASWMTHETPVLGTEAKLCNIT
jgi:hypothetical protein